MSAEADTKEKEVAGLAAEQPKPVRGSRKKTRKREARPANSNAEASLETTKQAKPAQKSRRGRRKTPSRQPSRRKTGKAKAKGRTGGASDYPRHSVRKALRIPRAILEQNAGRACTDREAATFSGVKYHGPISDRTQLRYQVRLSI